VKSVTPKNNKAIDQQLKDADGKLTVVQPNQIARSNSGQQSSNLKGGSGNQNTPEASFDEPQRGKRKGSTRFDQSPHSPRSSTSKIQMVKDLLQTLL